MVCHCQVSMTFVLKWRHIVCSVCWNLLVLNEPRSRGLVHNWLCVVFLTGIVLIGHTQVRLTADHKRMPSVGSTGRNGLKQNELVTIPLVNERVDVGAASRVIIGKDEECVTLDVEGLHIAGSISLKRLHFDEVSSWPLEHSGLNRILLLGVVIVCKSDESVVVYHKRRTSQGSFSWYLLKLVKLAAAPFVHDWFCGLGSSIIVVCHCEVFFTIYHEKSEVACFFCRYALKDDKQLSIPLVNNRVQYAGSIITIGHSEEMFTSDWKVLKTIRASSLQGLIQNKFSSWFVHLVDHGVCLVLSNVAMVVGKSKKQTSTNGEMFHICSPSAW